MYRVSVCTTLIRGELTNSIIVGLTGRRCTNLTVTLVVPNPPHSLPFTEWAEVEKLHSTGTGHWHYDLVFVHHWVIVQLHAIIVKICHSSDLYCFV